MAKRKLLGHDNRVSSLAWHEESSILASAGYDGTVRLWTVKPDKPPMLDFTFVFRTSEDTFGNDLQGKLIGHLCWSPKGDYLAASLDSVVNIWPMKKSDQSEGYDWLIEEQKEFITTMCWPKTKNEEVIDRENLLIGKIDGNGFGGVYTRFVRLNL